MAGWALVEERRLGGGRIELRYLLRDRRPVTVTIAVRRYSPEAIAAIGEQLWAEERPPTRLRHD